MGPLQAPSTTTSREGLICVLADKFRRCDVVHLQYSSVWTLLKFISVCILIWDGGMWNLLQDLNGMWSPPHNPQGLRWDPQNQYSYEASVVMVNSPLPLAVNLEIKISRKNRTLEFSARKPSAVDFPWGSWAAMVPWCGHEVARPGAPVVVATGMVPTAVRRATAASQRPVAEVGASHRKIRRNRLDMLTFAYILYIYDFITTLKYMTLSPL